MTMAKIFPPGTRVALDMGEYGTWYGRVVVCLCKRHVWQLTLKARECGHAGCGYWPQPEACPWPMHVVWDSHWSDIDGPDESHQGMDGLTAVTAS